MFPVLPRARTADGGCAHSIVGRNGAHRSRIRSNSDDVGVVQLGHAVDCARRSARASLHSPVRHVVGVCAQPKMTGIDAHRVIAPMTDHQAGRNWPTESKEGQPMCQARPTAPTHPAVGCIGKEPTEPKPAPAIWFRDRVVFKSAGQGKASRNAALCYAGMSHDRGPFAKLVRAGLRADTRVRPAFCTMACGSAL